MTAPRLRDNVTRGLRSWGLPGPYLHRTWTPASSAGWTLPAEEQVLAVGAGRSYGDVGLNSGHGAILTRRMDRLLDFDPEQGVLECEAGVSIDEIVGLMLPRGWFPAVVPGTRFVTIGGAIANDVHGKNHHVAGSFGEHVVSFQLLRGDGSVVPCSRETNSQLFAATIGGLGLTGVVLNAKIRLRRLDSAWMKVATRCFRSFAEFEALEREAQVRREYTVAWVDCLSSRSGRLRGVHMAGDHAPSEALLGRPVFATRRPPRALPMHPPFCLVNRLSVRALNAAYWARSEEGEQLQGIYDFFWPLDGLLDWNRLYGPAGLFQFQCVLPPSEASCGIVHLLDLAARHGEASFLAVLKTFTVRPTKGMLSFAREGTTLAMDFPNRGKPTRALLAELESVVLEAGGAIYAAKDACMSARMFHAGNPRFAEFLPHRDIHFASDLWRRVRGETA